MVAFSDEFPHILSFMKNIAGSNSPSGFVGAQHPPEAMHGFPMMVGDSTTVSGNLPDLQISL
jgi:hypothetical protein